MKQLMFCYKQDRKLRVRHSILTDVFIPTRDIISPQKSTLTIPKTNKVDLNDIVIIRDNDTGAIEYIGYIDTLTNKVTTEIYCYPILNALDNDFVLDQLSYRMLQAGEYVDAEADVVGWLIAQLRRAFIDTDDSLQALPLIIRNFTKQPVFHKKAIDSANLFEVYTDLFIETGVYLEFSGLRFNGSEIDGIYCDIHCNKVEKAFDLRWDDPTIQEVDIIDNTFTNYNKVIATEELPEGSSATPRRYFFYLLNDNSITTNPNDPRRIKQVRSKEITFSIDEESTTAENVAALMLAVFNELQAPEYNLKISIKMFNTDKVKLYQRVHFTAESGIIYTSNVTKIEIVNDMQIAVTLGALRNSLTDFKKKVEAI